MSLPELLKTAVYFDGELAAIEAEFCGRWTVPLALLPPGKAKRLAAWLTHPTEARKAAYAAVLDHAIYPIAMAMHYLENPEKYARGPARKTPTARAQARTFDAIQAFLDEPETP